MGKGFCASLGTSRTSTKQSFVKWVKSRADGERLNYITFVSLLRKTIPYDVI